MCSLLVNYNLNIMIRESYTKSDALYAKITLETQKRDYHYFKRYIINYEKNSRYHILAVINVIFYSSTVYVNYHTDPFISNTYLYFLKTIFSK